MNTVKFGRGFNTDIVFCLDVNGSMAKIIDRVKIDLTGIFEKLKKESELRGKFDFGLRVKFITFGDCSCGTNRITESEFFVLPEEREKLTSFLNGVEVSVGADLSGSALEALTLAVRSNWDNSYDNRRKTVVLITDAPACKFRDMKNCESYPENMPEDTEELYSEWKTLGNGRRMLIIAPDKEPWMEIGREWDRTYFINFENFYEGNEQLSDNLASLLFNAY